MATTAAADSFQPAADRATAGFDAKQAQTATMPSRPAFGGLDDCPARAVRHEAATAPRADLPQGEPHPKVPTIAPVRRRELFQHEAASRKSASPDGGQTSASLRRSVMPQPDAKIYHPHFSHHHCRARHAPSDTPARYHACDVPREVEGRGAACDQHDDRRRSWSDASGADISRSSVPCQPQRGLLMFNGTTTAVEVPCCTASGIACFACQARYAAEPAASTITVTPASLRTHRQTRTAPPELPAASPLTCPGWLAQSFRGLDATTDVTRRPGAMPPDRCAGSTAWLPWLPLGAREQRAAHVVAVSPEPSTAA